MLLTGVFGLPPLYHEDDAQRAVYCALFILKALAERDLHASVGVTTGIVFSGSVGSNMRREYSILGVSTTPSARPLLPGTHAQSTREVDVRSWQVDNTRVRTCQHTKPHSHSRAHIHTSSHRP